MHPFDWFLTFVPLAIALLVGIGCRRYVRSVSDFLAGGRAAGRYLLSTAQAQLGAGAVMFIALFEVFQHSGFVTNWWQQISVPVALLLSTTGFVYYRFRQTRAFTLAQFFEIRYSRNLRLFTGVLGFVSGLFNFGIVPVIGARFFVSFLELPHEVNLFGWTVPTFALLMAAFLSTSTVLITVGGQVSVLVTNCLEGIFSQIGFLIIAVALVLLMNWTAVDSALLDRPPGKSMVNPFDSFDVADFNVWWVLIGISFYAYGTMAWQNSHAFSASASSPHESRMSNILLTWRQMFGLLLVIALLGLFTVTSLHQAGRVVDGVAGASYSSQQGLLPSALAEFLPMGIKGLVGAVVLMGVISGDAIHLHSWSTIFVQDVWIPLQRGVVSQKRHLFTLRFTAVCVAVFAFAFGLLFNQTEYIVMWFQVTTAIYVGGAGAIIIGGLYWNRGTTEGAWAGLIAGSLLSSGGILMRQFHPDFFLNGAQISFFSALIAVITYVGVSLLTSRAAFDMDRLLHRGKYAVEPAAASLSEASPRRNWREIILGTDPNFTKSDRLVASVIFLWSFLTFAAFVVGTIVYISHPWSDHGWIAYWKVTVIWIPLVFTGITTVWLTFGCCFDLSKFFARLRIERIDLDDNGQVRKDEEK